MTKPQCIITEPDWIPMQCMETLKTKFDLILGPFDKEGLVQAAKNADGMLVGLDHVLGADILSQSVRFIVSPTTGLNHIDLKYCESNAIKVISLKGEVAFLRGITATSELCWGLILALTRHIPVAIHSVNAGEWDRDHFIGHELQGATLGIIGFGRLGSKIARYAKAFDMRVLAHTLEDINSDGVEVVDLDTLLQESSIVSLHADSRPENYRMIDGAAFSKMQEGACFINTARGDLIDEAALLEHLKNGHLAGAALDVLEMEFSQNSHSQALIEYAKAHDNLIITPHIGGVTYESQFKTTNFVIEKLLQWWRAGMQK